MIKAILAISAPSLVLVVFNKYSPKSCVYTYIFQIVDKVLDKDALSKVFEGL